MGGLRGRARRDRHRGHRRWIGPPRRLSERERRVTTDGNADRGRGGGGGGGESTPASLPAGDPIDGTRSLDAAAVTVEGNGNDEFGFAPAVGDVNGDGVPDVVVVAPRNNGGARNGGAVYVVHGGAGLDGTVPLGSVDANLAGVVPRSLTGYSVAAADLTGDGQAEVVAGSPRNGTGRAYLVDGKRVGSVDSLAAADATFAGAAGDRAGSTVDAAGDANCDGRLDLLVGAPGNDAGGTDAGAAYVVVADASDEVGRAAGVGVVPGDGTTGLVVGAPFGETPQTAHVVYAGCPAE